VIFEAPGRTHQSLVEFANVLGPSRPAALIRELTKKFESVTRSTLGALAALTEREEVRGEVVLVIGAGEEIEPDDAEVDAAILHALERGERMKDVARFVAQRFSLDQRSTYDRARELRSTTPGD
jgi:16S rRNA (cytidine1402-2'-O)-methyltransferase